MLLTGSILVNPRTYRRRNSWQLLAAVYSIALWRAVGDPGPTSEVYDHCPTPCDSRAAELEVAIGPGATIGIERQGIGCSEIDSQLAQHGANCCEHGLAGAQTPVPVDIDEGDPPQLPLARPGTTIDRIARTDADPLPFVHSRHSG